MIIYRRDLISVSCHLPYFTLGNNLYVWYGYKNSNNTYENMIVDAKIIKAQMASDLKKFDHNVVIGNSDNYISSLVEVGYDIFKNAIACGRKALSNICIEDCYGNTIYISNQGANVTIPFYAYENDIVFRFNDEQRATLYKKNIKSYYLSILHFDNSYPKEHIVCANLNTNQIPVGTIISTVDTGTGYIVSRSPCFAGKVVLTVSCIMHFEHQVGDSNKLSKCSNMHGHSYYCSVSILCTEENALYVTYVHQMEKMLRELLQYAFTGGCQVTTSENITSFVKNSMKKKYAVIRVCLKETNNIMTVIEDNIMEE